MSAPEDEEEDYQIPSPEPLDNFFVPSPAPSPFVLAPSPLEDGVGRRLLEDFDGEEITVSSFIQCCLVAGL